MSKKIVSRAPIKDKPREPSDRQAPQQPLTLADLRVTWCAGGEDRQVTGEQLALALDHALARTNDGRGDWDYCLADLDNAVNQLKEVELLLAGLACQETAELSLAPEAFGALEGAVENARSTVETAFIREIRRKYGREYRVQINQPAA